MRPAIIDERITIDPCTVPSFHGDPHIPGARVVPLSILVDDQGTSTIDNVTLNGEKLR